jgi:cytoskeletal protein CcmA (bactofilin family)
MEKKAMSKHLIKGLFFILLIPLLMLCTAVPVLAADTRGGDTVTVSSGETVDDDLYIGGNEIVINGTVNGDVWAAGRTITINGAVTGSVVAVGQTVTINGEIARAARIAGNELTVNGSVDGDLLAFGATLDVEEAARVGGDLVTGAQNVRISGSVGKNIKGGAGALRLSGSVGGNIDLEVDTLTITSTAHVGGNLTYLSNNEASVDSGAAIQGTTVHNIPEAKEKPGIAGKITGKVVAFVMALLIGIIIIVIAPRKLIAMADTIRHRPLPCLGWGAVLLFAVPVAAIVVCFTVIGLPIGLISLALWGIALYLSQIPAALFLGRLIIRRATTTESKGLQIGAFAAGLAIIVILRNIPYLGFIVGLAVFLFGLGSLISLVHKPANETTMNT